MIRFRVLAGLMAALVMLAASGCRITMSGGEREPVLPPAATKVGDTEVWDLRVRPDSDSVGIGDGDTAVFETRPSRPALIRLAEGAELRLPLRYAAFSTIGSPDDSPVGVDLKTETMPLDDTVDAYGSMLEQLGLPDDGVTEFEHAAAVAGGTERVLSERASGRFGDLELGLVARYSPHSESGVVAVSGGWHGD